MRCLIFVLSLLASTASFAAGAEPISYVLLGPNGVPVVRTISAAPTCPALIVDGHLHAMTLRAPAETAPLRPTISAPEKSKPSAFPVTACEAVLAAGAKKASVDGHPLPLPKPRLERIVVIGDTGCRLKGNEIQACNDPAAYPFARTAAQAAAWKPDLVLHVGDYQYRETGCPDDRHGCDGSPWGYGWDTWQADFFAPGAPLLRTAPLVLVRGNHENCARAGQGWMRFLDLNPMAGGRNCDDPARDAANDDSPVYAVPLGGGAQIVVMDMAYADEGKPLDPADPAAAPIRAAYERLDALSRNATFTFAASHKPILGFSASEKKGVVKMRPGNLAIQSVFRTLNPDLFPSKVDALLSGHYHVWEQVSFSTPHPTQFVAGFSGTQEDIVPMPEKLSAVDTPAAGAVPNRFSSWINGFGYMTMERAGPRRWNVKVWNLAGQVVNTCEIDGRHSACAKARVH